MVTEKEAQAMRCPLAGIAGGETQGRCLGSRCMAWRWAGAYDQKTGEEVGYCGLAGRPE